MTKYDILYSSAMEKGRVFINKLRDYLQTEKWLVVVEDKAQPERAMIHFVKGTGSILYYRGPDWVCLSVVDRAGTKTIDNLLENNPSLKKKNANCFKRRIADDSK